MSMEQDNAYYLRKMRDGDIPQVLEIDLEAFPTQWPHPTLNSFRHEMRNRLAHYIVVYRNNTERRYIPPPGSTAWSRAISRIRYLFNHDRFFGPASNLDRYKLVGMAGIWMMVDEAHIVTIGVRKAERNHGLGEWMLIYIIDMAIQLGAKIVTLEVRVSNTVAQQLYAKYGFTIVGTRRKYYSDNGEDAYIMSTEALMSDEYQARFQRMKYEHRQRWKHCCEIN